MDWETRQLDWVNRGIVWKAHETVLRASVTAVPTTTAGFSIWNGEPKGGDNYVILGVYAVQGGTPAALNSWGLVGQISDLAVGTAAATADLVSATIATNLKGNSGVYSGAAVFDIDLGVLDDQWVPLGYSVNTSVIILTGTQVYVPQYVPWIAPPGAVFSLEAVASALDVTTRCGFIWAEVSSEELDSLGL